MYVGAISAPVYWIRENREHISESMPADDAFELSPEKQEPLDDSLGASSL